MADLNDPKELKKVLKEFVKEVSNTSNTVSERAIYLKTELEKLKELSKKDISNRHYYEQEEERINKKIIKLEKNHTDDIKKQYDEQKKILNEQILLETRKQNNLESVLKHGKEKFQIEKSLNEWNKLYAKDTIQYFKDSGFAIKEFDSNNKHQRESLDSLIKFNKEKIDFEKKIKKQREEHWYLEEKFWGKQGRGMTLAAGQWDKAKTWFKEETGILGKGTMFIAGLAGLRKGKRQDIKQREMEKANEPIQLVSQLQESFNSTSIKIASSFEDFESGFIKTLNDGINKIVNKMEDIDWSFLKSVHVKGKSSESGMRDERKGDSLAEQKLTNKSLKKMLAKMDKSSMGLMGLAGLLGLGGLIGFLMTGKSEFLGDMVKGLVKGGLVLQKALSSALKLPKLFGGKAIKGIIGKFGDFGLGSIWKNLYKGAGGLAKTLGKFGKIGGLIGKTVQGIGKAFGIAALKKLPLIGLLISIPLAIMRFKKGDILGGFLELASGGISVIPGIGTALSIAIDLISLFRDSSRAMSGASGPNKPLIGKGGKGISNAIKNPVKTVMSGGKNIDIESGTSTQTSNNQIQRAEVSSNEQIQYNSRSPETSTDDKENARTFRLHPDDIDELAKQISKGTGSEFNKALQNGNSGQPASRM